MATYKGDPYWTTAKFNSVTKYCEPVKKGDRIFYYPRTKEVLTGARAEEAAAYFEAQKFDESVYNGQW